MARRWKPLSREKDWQRLEIFNLLEDWSAEQWRRRSLGELHRPKGLECWGATLLCRSNLGQAGGDATKRYKSN